MARDVEADLTLRDKTGPGLSSAEERLRRSQERQTRMVEQEQRKQEAAVKRQYNEQEKLRKRAEQDRKKQDAEIKENLGMFSDLVSSISPKLAASLASGIEAGGNAIGPVLIGAALAAAPFLGAVISGAVVGGVGLGGVVGGVMLAARDPRVKSAGQELGQFLLGSLEADAAPFVEPVLGAIDMIEKRFGEVEGTIQSIFAHAAPFLEPLVDGLTRGVQSVLRGVDTLVSRAGPEISAIAGGFAELGDSIGSALDTLSQNGPAAAVALRETFGAVSATIDTVASSISGLTTVYGWAVKFGLAGGEAQRQWIAYDAAAKIADATTVDLSTSLQGAAGAAAAQAVAAAGAAGAVKALEKVTAELAQANRALYGSDTDVVNSLTDMNKKLRENGETHSLASKKGRENRQALDQLAGALRTNYDNYVKVNGESQKTVARGALLRSAFIKAAEGAHYTATEANNLANQILGIPSNKTVKIKGDAASAVAAALAAQEAVNNLHGKTIDVNVVVNAGRLSKVQNQLSRFGARDFDASSTWGASGGGGMSRTGGPTGITVDNSLYVSWDGGPYRAYATNAARSARKRQDYEQRVGVR